MEPMTIVSKAREMGINFGNIWFIDIAGKIKTFAFSLDKLEASLDEGLGFDGSSVTGFQDITESDLVIKPDLNTALFLGEEVFGMPSLVFLGNIFTPDYQVFEGDSRAILRRTVEEDLTPSQRLNIGAELEFFFFRANKPREIIDKGSYFDMIIFDEATKILNEIANTLIKLGIDTEYYHHEVADSQFEVDLQYSDAHLIADRVIIARAIIKKIAAKYGIYASFMPKPLFQKAGNGLHTHMSIFDGDRNLMAAEKDLSDFGKSFLTGIIDHIKEIALLTNPTVNSYKRLVPGYEAPVYVAWGHNNRSTLIRVPQFNAKKPKSIRIEVRNPDPSCNPYLAYAALFKAGMSGVKAGSKAPDPVEFNIFDLTQKDVIQKGIDTLPDSLESALNKAKSGTMVKELLGAPLYKRYIALKEDEWKRFSNNVTQWEIDEYYYEF